MSSTILYKFRSGTTFEALPLPGSAARLWDVKKAIVSAKKLDSGGMAMEFDLSVRDATTNQEYTDESMLLPRGTRVIVQRLPAARGFGFLARLARSQATGGPMTSMMSATTGSTQHSNNSSSFYTIDSRAHEDDEFVSSASAAASAVDSEEQELAALRAAISDPTAAAGSSSSSARALLAGGGGRGGGRHPPPAGAGGPPGRQQQHHHHQFHHSQQQNAQQQGGGGQNQMSSGSSSFRGGGGHQHFARPNADPELRDQEKQLLPKKRATGIPRTFLSLSAPPVTDGSFDAAHRDGGGGGGGEGGVGSGGGSSSANVPLLQPNVMGFEELVHRGGGQSESAAGTKRDLDYAIKVTASSIPEYLQCALCHSVVKDAMILPWDPEGRTTCDSCIRDALTKNGFRCPLTSQEGVSPDDLLPNAGLRRAADQFIKGVFEKLQEIEQQVDDDDDEQPDSTVVGGGGAGRSKTTDMLDGDNAEKGVLISNKKTSHMDRRKHDDDDPFGGGDADFGGDVFAVAEKPEVRTKEDSDEKQDSQVPVNDKASEEAPVIPGTPVVEPGPTEEKKENISAKNTGTSPKNDIDGPNKSASDAEGDGDRSNKSSSSAKVSHRVDNNNTQSARAASPAREQTPESQQNSSGSRRDAAKRRGPPVGYAMGPAHPGAAVVGPVVESSAYEDRSGGGRGMGGRRGGGTPRGGGRSDFFESASTGSVGSSGFHDRPFRGGRGDHRGGRRGGGRFGGGRQEGRGDYRDNNYEDANGRGTKRPWSESAAESSRPDDASVDPSLAQHRERAVAGRDDYVPRGGRGGGRFRGGGGPTGGGPAVGGGYRGGGGRWEDRGGASGGGGRWEDRGGGGRWEDRGGGRGFRGGGRGFRGGRGRY